MSLPTLSHPEHPCVVNITCRDTVPLTQRKQRVKPKEERRIRIRNQGWLNPVSDGGRKIVQVVHNPVTTATIATR